MDVRCPVEAERQQGDRAWDQRDGEEVGFLGWRWIEDGGTDGGEDGEGGWSRRMENGGGRWRWRVDGAWRWRMMGTQGGTGCRSSPRPCGGAGTQLAHQLPAGR